MSAVNRECGLVVGIVRLPDLFIVVELGGDERVIAGWRGAMGVAGLKLCLIVIS